MGESGEYIELSALQNLIKSRVGDIQAWVKVEIDSHSESGGHHYFGLIEKSKTGAELAKARGIIWRSNALIINQFQAATGKRLGAGLSVGVLVSVNYDARFGLSLIIHSIDASYSIGLREQEKKETIRRLTESGLMDMQKSTLGLPFLPSRIAVISSAEAAGYGDFMKHVNQSRWAGAMHFSLFAAPMQGEGCAAGIIEALSQVEENKFDLAVIIRGGGSDMDLKPYDDYELALNVAQFPLPVLTGIGHDRDYHVIDMVAHTWFKTPTAVADFLIEMFENQWNRLFELGTRVSEAIESRVNAGLYELSSMEKRLQYAVGSLLSSRENALRLMESKLENVNPERILGKGFALVLDKYGRRISEPQELPDNGRITLVMGRTMVEYEVVRIASREFGE